jgi:uncharacterized protein (TIGR03067 family)
MGEVPAPDRDSSWADVRPVLDAEVGRLPAKLRDALVLCELQGVGRDEAAARLGISAGTLSRRLARAKDALRARLARRGLTLSAAGLGLVLTEAGAPAAVPGPVVQSTTAAAVAAASHEETGMLLGNLLTKLVLALATAAGLTAGAVVLTADPPAVKADLEAMQGEWTMEKSAPDDVDSVHDRTFVIDWAAILLSEKGQGGRLTIKLDPTKSPKWIDLTARKVRGLTDGDTLPGVYSVEGDKLVINLATRKGQKRPTRLDTFESYVTDAAVNAEDPDQASRWRAMKRVKK